MALTTYTELKAAVTELLNRADVISDAQIADFITLAEAQMNRRLKTRRQVGRAEATINSEFVSLPAGFAGPRTMELVSQPNVNLEFVEPERAQELQATLYVSSGQPAVYTVIGDEFQFLPAPDMDYTANLTYYKKITALSDSNVSNWVLADHPDAYLYGAAIHSAPWLKNDERLSLWASFFETALADMTKSDAVEAYGRLNMRLSRAFG